MNSVRDKSTWYLCGYGSSAVPFRSWIAWDRILKYCYMRGKQINVSIQNPNQNIEGLITKLKSHIGVKRLLIQQTGILRSLVIGFLLLLHLFFDLGLFLSRLLLSFHSSLQLTDEEEDRRIQR